MREIEEVIEDPFLRDRGIVQTVDHPVTAEGIVFGVPWTIDGQSIAIRSHSPLLGDANAFVNNRAAMGSEQ